MTVDKILCLFYFDLQESGVIVMSDMNIETRPCIKRSVQYNCMHCAIALIKR